MNPPPRAAAAALAVALALTACGGGDDGASDAVGSAPSAPSGSAAPTPTEAPASDVTDASADGTPAPTIPADAPEALLPGIGPIAVVGEPLPDLPQSGPDPAVGVDAPILIGETFAGEPVRVDPAADGPTWIVFLAHWCPHCNDEIPVINQLRDEGRLPASVNIVGVSTAVSPERPNWPPGEWLHDMDWTFTAFPDGIDVEAQTFVAATAYGISGFPFSVLVDGDGKVTARWSGGRDADELVSMITTNLSLT